MNKSNVTGKQYDPVHAAYIVNMRQAYLYLRNGADLLDILYTNTKTGSLVFVFKKDDNLHCLYELWNQHKLK